VQKPRLIRPRALLVSGLALLMLAGITAALLRFTYGERTAYVHVRWRPGVDSATQQDVESAHRLIRLEFRGDRTWEYLLTDLSRNNISSLLHHPAVEDTQHFERGQARIASTAPRGNYPTDRHAWIRAGLDLLRDAFLAAGMLVLALGVFSGWRYSRRCVSAVPQTPTLQLVRGGSRAAWLLVFGGCIATLVVLLGTRDLESFETAFFSLDRGTAAGVVRLLGQPVYTTAVGLGVRLPLHGSLGASPAAALAPYLPEPLTYWLLIAFSIAASAMVVRHALEPICGPVVSWLALLLLFWSVPTVNYTIYDDWPETAVTYCAFVAAVFAPHALLASVAGDGDTRGRRIAWASIAATVWSLIALSHPGYWPLLGATWALASTLALLRPEALRTKAWAAAVLGIVSLPAVVLQTPDILRELTGGGTVDASQMQRFVQGPTGSLMHANAFPFEQAGARMPFTYLALVLLSLFIGLISENRPLRRLAIGGGLVAIMCGISAATLSPTAWKYAPTATWAFRDPAIAFAVLSGAAAVATARTSRGVRAVVGARLAIAALALAGSQGLAYASYLVITELREGGQRSPWTQDMTRAQDRVRLLGLAPDQFPPGERLALWPGLREKLRTRQRPSVDFADAGYLLVTASTKDRTMRGLVEPNKFLFNQETDLAVQVLCNADAVQFLQLRYLIAPPRVECQPWDRLPKVRIDGMEVGFTDVDRRARILPLSRLTEPIVRKPGLSAGSSLLSAVAPLPGTLVTLRPSGATLQLDNPARAEGHALVLPLAYDSALRTSSGRVQNVGGLTALIEVDQRHVTVEFVPDVIAILRAASMTLAQLLAVIGFVGMTRVSWAHTDNTLALRGFTLNARWRRIIASGTVPIARTLLERRNWLYVGYGGAVLYDANLFGALLPLTVFGIARLTQREWWYRAVAGAFFALAVIRVATAGSLSPYAVRDPLFWGVLAVGAFAVSAVTGRWPVAASVASFAAGVFTSVATLLPMAPDFHSSFPNLQLYAVAVSFDALAHRFGVVTVFFMLGVWLQAIGFRGPGGRTTQRIDAAIRGGLVAWLVLTLAGAVPLAGTEAVWIVALGVLVGLAEARARNR